MGSEIVDLLARWPSLQHCLLKTIFEEALGKKSIADDTGVMMEDGSKVLINDIIRYPLFTEAKKKVCLLVRICSFRVYKTLCHV